MTVSGEQFAAMNLLMNALILSLAARRTARRLTAARALAAALAGTVYAFAAWGRAPLLRSLPGVVLSGVCMALIAFGRDPRAAAYVLAGGCLAAGVTGFLTGRGAPPPLALTVSAAALVIAGRVTGGRGARGTARVVFRGREIALPLLLDTGNLLTDPVTGRSVAVAPYALVRDILPPLDPKDLTTMPGGFRLLSARTAGGLKTFMCFRPDAFRVRVGGAYRDRDAVIAVSDMPGEYALIGEGLMTKGRSP